MTGANKAIELDKEYHIHEKVIDTLKTGVTKAQEINQEYDITGKIATGIKAGAEKVMEVNEKYQIQQRVGEALYNGFNSLYNAVTGSAEPSQLGGDNAPAQ